MSLRRPNGFISAGFNPLEVPNAPTIGTATSAGPTAVSVTFTAPANVGGSAITGYVATAKKTSDGTTISGTGSSSPVTISGLTTNSAYTVTVAAVNSFGLGLSSAASNSVTPFEQQLWAWGGNAYGQLGLNNASTRNSPNQVGSGDWENMAAGRAFSVAVKTNGTLWAWGRNSGGALGLGDTVNRSSPVQIGALTTWASVAAGSAHCIAIKTDGTAWSWGEGSQGRLSQNGSANYSSPKQIGTSAVWAKAAAGVYNTALLSTSGGLWTCGFGLYGANGLGNANAQNYIQPLGSGFSDVRLLGYSMVALKPSGQLWIWGRNNKGQLGLGDTYNRSSPVQVGALTTWSKISGGMAACFAVKTDGTLWGWGRNYVNYLALGFLGLNDVVDRSSPAQIGALTTWYDVNAGAYSTMASKTDGALWIWGYNGSGQLGQGNTINRSSPVQVGALTTWYRLPQGPTALSSFAIKTS